MYELYGFIYVLLAFFFYGVFSGYTKQNDLGIWLLAFFFPLSLFILIIFKVFLLTLKIGKWIGEKIEKRFF